MSEWWFFIVLLTCALVALLCFIYPLRRNSLLSLVLAPIILLLASGGYYFFGSYSQWQEYTQHEESQKRAQQMLKSVKNPQELISKLKEKLDDTPKSAKGWYLLGRLYMAQNELKNSVSAFAKAHAFAPDNEQYAVNYAHGLWQLNKQQFNPEIINIFKDLLKNNPNQADALAMLAMNAFMSHAYEDAIGYWQRLLQLAPEQSEESLAIRKAIAKAQEHINN